jgi:hypothetical protein
MIESPNLFQEFLNRLPSPLRELVRPSVPLRDLTTLPTRCHFFKLIMD